MSAELLESKLAEPRSSSEVFATLNVEAMVAKQGLLNGLDTTQLYDEIFVRREIPMPDSGNIKYLKRIDREGVVHVLKQEGDGPLISTSYLFKDGVRELGEASEARLAPGVIKVNYDGTERSLHTTDIAVLRPDDDYPGKDKAERIAQEFSDLSGIAIKEGDLINLVDEGGSDEAEQTSSDAEIKLGLIRQELETGEFRDFISSDLSKSKVERRIFVDLSHRLAMADSVIAEHLDNNIEKIEWQEAFEEAVEKSDENQRRLSAIDEANRVRAQAEADEFLKASEELELERAGKALKLIHLTHLGGGLEALKAKKEAKEKEVSPEVAQVLAKEPTKAPIILPLRENARIITKSLPGLVARRVKPRIDALVSASKPAIKGSRIGIGFGVKAVAGEIRTRRASGKIGKVISRGGAELPLSIPVSESVVPVVDLVPDVVVEIPASRVESAPVPLGRDHKGRFVRKSDGGNRALDRERQLIETTRASEVTPASIDPVVESGLSGHTAGIVFDSEVVGVGSGDHARFSVRGFEWELTLPDAELSRRDRRRIERILGRHDLSNGGLSLALKQVRDILGEVEDLDLVPASLSR